MTTNSTPEHVKDHCVWESFHDVYKFWRTECGKAFEGLREICPSCNKRIMLVGFDAWWERRKGYHP